MNREKIINRTLATGAILFALNFGAFTGTTSYPNYEIAKDAIDGIKKYVIPLYILTYPGTELGLEYVKENPIHGPIMNR